jgi:hypothetical protein
MEDGLTADHKNPGVAFWATVVVVVALVPYPLSFGPACWWFAKHSTGWDGCVGTSPPGIAPRAYWPFGWLAENGSRPVHDAIFWYATLREGYVLIPSECFGEKLSGPR